MRYAIAVASALLMMGALAPGLAAQDSKPAEAAGQGKEQQSNAAPHASAIASLSVAFKLDPRVSGATYGGARWVSPPTFTSAVQEGTQGSIEARVEAVNHNNRLVKTKPTWTAADPDMVVVSEVSPGKPDHVQITVKHPGASTLTVVADGVSRELRLQATPVAEGRGMQISISQ